MKLISTVIFGSLLLGACASSQVDRSRQPCSEPTNLGRLNWGRNPNSGQAWSISELQQFLDKKEFLSEELRAAISKAKKDLENETLALTKIETEGRGIEDNRFH